jgi:hypothetical protein
MQRGTDLDPLFEQGLAFQLRVKYRPQIHNSQALPPPIAHNMFFTCTLATSAWLHAPLSTSPFAVAIATLRVDSVTKLGAVVLPEPLLHRRFMFSERDKAVKINYSLSLHSFCIIHYTLFFIMNPDIMIVMMMMMIIIITHVSTY